MKNEIKTLPNKRASSASKKEVANKNEDKTTKKLA